MKKSQMLKFFFWTLVALIIFIPTALWATKFLKIKDKPAESYVELVQTVNSLNRDGEADSLPLYLNPDYLIVGFTRNADKIQSGISKPGIFGFGAGDNTHMEMQRPPQCKNGKSCLCLCKNGVELANADRLLTCTETVICNSFENVDFFETRPLSDIPLVSGIPQERFWKNGIFITHSGDINILKKVFALGGSGVVKINNPLPVYVQRYKNFINICYDKNCITDEMIDQTNEEEAIKEFQRLKEFYLTCKHSSECGAFSLNLPERNHAYYSRVAGDIAFPLGKTGKLFLVNTKNTEIDYIRENLQQLSVKDGENNGVSFDATLNNLNGEKTVQGQGFIITEYEEAILPRHFNLKKDNDNIIIETI